MMFMEIIAAQILQPDAEPLLTERIDFRHVDAECRQAASAGDKLGVVSPCHRVNHQHHGWMNFTGPGEAIEVTVGATFDDGLNLTGDSLQFRELLACENE